jgi:L-iditol 2-dehydrogenase
MLALVKTDVGPGRVQLMEVPDPEIRPEEVKIKVEAAGICGSDLHFYHGKGKDITIFPPVILGHEFGGTVVEVGPKVENWRIGDRVTSEPPVQTCGVCEYCMSGLPALCPQRRSLGSGLNGAFASYVVTTPNRLHRLPDNVDFLSGALAEPTACCVHAVLERGRVAGGDVVIVTGPGPIGLLTAQVAKAQGATVILVGTAEDLDRLAIGREVGVDRTLITEDGDVQTVLMQYTGGQGANVAFECAGVSQAVDTCLRVLKKRGHCIQVGVFADSVRVDFNLVGTRELSVTGSFGSTYTSWERALRLMSHGMVKVKPLVTLDVPITEWQQAFTRLETKQACKAVLRPVSK